ncbi:D-Ala-D-Ala carboxypeptidase family metallohydrolase [Marinobacter nauticus]|uniref:D-Ala-D-Ala carboxypeptidase family metallohydrolase n=1 Tax=Marinobacter nauticus TaxID=2743 RepID=UPI001C994AE5|nr:D-Ala-D-Ala carboxypeptidase family metallohydrolase [Marinobacter nauticus]MBY5962115.1 hypothetical protein [Marinobacter nauticus]
MKIAKNFTLEEFLKSDTADQHNITNDIDDLQHLVNLTALTNTILQPTRDHFKQFLIITSGYRNNQVNSLVSGSDTSQHRTGQAVDFYVIDKKAKDVVMYIAANYDFDQMIYYTATGHIHLSYTFDTNRKQLMINRDGKLEISNINHFSLQKF